MESVAKVRFPLAKAEHVANELRDLLESACIRIAIAGSIRRQRPDPADIELLCVPKPCNEILYTDALDEAVMGAPLDMRPNVKGRFTYGPLNKLMVVKGRFTYGPLNKLMVHRASGIPVDIFSTSVGNWGMSLMVRTGPKEWNVRFMARLLAQGMKGHAYGGITSATGQEIECPDEGTVFRALGWPYTPPEQRK